jgi:CubicO group peptidase (beta-lactamase class C family)
MEGIRMEESCKAVAEIVCTTFPDGIEAVQLPAGWTVEFNLGLLTTVGPERDLRIVFLTAPADAGLEATALAAWQRIEPGFDLALVQQVESPSATGWDSAGQIIYRTFSAEGRLAMAFVRVLNGRAYVNLVSATKAAFSRRMAQVSEVIEAWRPNGLAAPDLANRPAAAWNADFSRTLSTFITQAMSDLRAPGLSIAIVQGGHIVFAEGFGVRAVGGDAPVTPDTLFRIGSTTKALTTLMMARLVAEGRFTWETPVTTLLPDFRLGDPDTTARLQLRHTVSASTGMPRRDIDLMFKLKGVTPEDRLSEMAAMSPTTGFGETFQYSNYLVAAGGYAAAHAFAPDLPMAEAYDTALEQLILTPLGMRRSTLDLPAALECGAASPHALDFDGACAEIDQSQEAFVDAVAPAGAAWSSVLDLARYLKFELNGGVADDGERLISAAELGVRRQGGIKINERSRYGLGLFCATAQGLETIGHGGNTLGFTSDLWFIPEKDLGAVVLTNLRLANGLLSAIQAKIFELVFGGAATAELAIYAMAKSETQRLAALHERVKTDISSTAWIEALAGDYQCPELGPARIARQGESWWVEFESWGSRLGAEAQSDGARLLMLLSPPWSGTLSLQVQDDGAKLVLDGGQNQYVFERKSA